MLSDTQISRLLDVANAACHGGNVVDARAMYAGVLALRPGFAPALMGKALSHIVVARSAGRNPERKAPGNRP